MLIKMQYFYKIIAKIIKSIAPTCIPVDKYLSNLFSRYILPEFFAVAALTTRSSLAILSPENVFLKILFSNLFKRSASDLSE